LIFPGSEGAAIRRAGAKVLTMILRVAIAICGALWKAVAQSQQRQQAGRSTVRRR
jgi:hypothetical protein